MPDLPTRTELFNIFADDIIGRGEARPNGRRVTPEEVFTEGSDLNLLGAGASAMAEEVVRQLSRGLTDLTLDGAEGEALDRLVADRYSNEVNRKGATTSRVTLTFTRTSTGAGGVTVETGSRFSSDGGVVFETTAAASFGAASLGPVTAPARAVDAGTGGNVAAGTIQRFVSTTPDPTILVTNATPAAGGDAKESDASFRERARAYFKIVRRGTLGAIEFGALTVAGVRQATAEEEVDADTGNLTGRVFVYIADANGQANSLLETEVADALLEWRGAGVTVTVVGAFPVFAAITLSLSFQAGVDTVVAFDQVRRYVVAAVNQTRPNLTLYRSVITGAASRVAGVIVSDGAVVAPAGDLVPDTGEVIRTRTDLITSV